MSDSIRIMYKQGDVTKMRPKTSFILMHCCNNKGYYNAGVARAIRNKWLGAYESYLSYKHIIGLFLGSVDFWHNKEESMWVANCIGQDGCGPGDRCYVKYECLRNCFVLVRKKALKEKVPVVAPMLGSGLAGGDWKIIKKMIQEELCDHGVSVYIYQLPKK